MPDVVTDIFGIDAQKDAAQTAAEAQVRAAQLAVDEQRRQFDATRELLNPFVQAGEAAIPGMQSFAGVADPSLNVLQQYVQAGPAALEAQQTLAGLRGQEEQAAAIEAIKQGPEYQEMLGAGSEAILQSASATGGLRGGRTQEALGELGSGLLTNLVERQYNRLGGLAGQAGNVGQFLTNVGQSSTQNLFGGGQASAAGVAQAGQQTAGNIANLLQTSGTAQANAALRGGLAESKMLNSFGTGLKDLGTAYLTRGDKGRSGGFAGFMEGLF